MHNICAQETYIICLIPVKARKQLGLQMAVNHYVGARNQIQVLC